jgi:hypothetical protein
MNIDTYGADIETTHEELNELIDTYKNLFLVIDLVFSKLRIPGPNDEDMQNAEKPLVSSSNSG